MRLHLLCALLMSVVFLAPTAQCQELLPVNNPGFEDDLRHWSPKIEPAEPEAIQIDTEVFHSGKASLRIRQARSSSYSNVVQPIAVEPYHNYVARCWIKADDVKRSGIGLNFYIGDIRGFSVRAIEDDTQREGTFDWRQVTIPFNSGRHEMITIIPYLHESTGTVWFDDIELFPLETGWKPPEGVQPRPMINAPALPLDRQFNYDTVSTEIETPHLVWARPLAGGPIRVLVIAPAWAQRESIELAQRCDVKVTALMTHRRDALGVDNQHYGALTRAEAEALATSKADGSYDVIIIGKVRWSILPETVREKLLAQVRGGAGLVWILGPGDELPREIAAVLSPSPEVAEALPLASLPALNAYASDYDAAAGSCRAGDLDQGRVVILDYGEQQLAGHHYLTPAMDGPPAEPALHYEYYQALLCRAVLAAAARDTVRISLAAPNMTGNSGTINAHLASDAPRRATLELTMRSADGRHAVAAPTQEVTISADGTDLRLVVPPGLPAGPCYAELRLRSDDGTIGFAAVAADVGLAVSVDGLTVQPGRVAPGDEFSVKGEVRSLLAQLQTTTIRCFDAHGREWAHATLPRPIGPFAIGIPATGSLTVGNRIVVEVRDDRQLLAETSLPLLIRHPYPVDDFSLVLWPGAGRDYIGYRLWEIVARDYGGDIVDMGAGPWEPTPLSEPDRAGLRTMLDLVTGLDMRPLPYISRIWAEKLSENGLIRTPCLSDPAYLQSLTDSLKERAAICADYAPAGYTLGDECFVATSGDVCFSEHCVADFPEFLLRRHGSRATITSAWGKPQPAPIKLPLMKAREQTSPAAWVDHRLHAEDRFTETIALGREAIREVDPGARVGFDGAFPTGTHSGYDWWALSRCMDIWNVYWQRDQHLAMKSFASADTLTGLWYGGYVYGPAGKTHAHGVRWLPWYSLAHRMNGAWFYSPYTVVGGAGETGFGPDFHPFPCWSNSAEELAEIKAGIGKLILTAEPYPPQVGIVLSPASMHALTYHALTPGHTSSVERGAELLEDLCVPYELIADTAIAEGALRQKPYRALWLPMASALSERTSRAIERFARDGGLVIADALPAVFTESGAPLEHGRLDGLFGIKRTGPIKLEMLIGGVDGFMPVVACDQGIEAAGARAAENVDAIPLLMRHTGGGGAAALLNLTLDGYKEMRGPMGVGVRARVMELLRSAGVQRPAVLSARGDIADQVLTSVFSAGGNRYVLAVRHPYASWEPESVVVSFAQRSHVYDCRSGSYLGETDRAETTMMPGDARLWAVLPERIEGLTLTATPGAQPGDDTEIAVDLHGATPDAHGVLHLQVTGPDGAAISWLAQNAVITGAAATLRVPSALNDPTGTYTATVRHVASGAGAHCTWTIAR